MKLHIIVGSVREGRTAIKIANWLLSEIESYDYSRFLS